MQIHSETTMLSNLDVVRELFNSEGLDMDLITKLLKHFNLLLDDETMTTIFKKLSLSDYLKLIETCNSTYELNTKHLFTSIVYNADDNMCTYLYETLGLRLSPSVIEDIRTTSVRLSDYKHNILYQMSDTLFPNHPDTDT